MACCASENYGVPLRSFLKTSVCFKEPPLSWAYEQSQINERSLALLPTSLRLRSGRSAGGSFPGRLVNSCIHTRKVTEAGDTQSEGQPMCQTAWARKQTARDVA